MNCPVCKNNNFAPLMKKGELTLVECLDCRLVQMEDLLASFDIKYYEYYKDRLNIKKEDLYNPITTKRYLTLLNKMEPYRNNNTLIDIGCGQGHFVDTAKNMQWKAEGIETAPYAIDICNKFDLNVTNGDLLTNNLKKNHYDVVSMFEVLEHLTHPKEYLMEANNILRKNGVFLLTTPNYNCMTRFLLQEKWSMICKEHLLYFTPKTLRMILEKCNFKVVEIRITLLTLPDYYNLFTEKNIKLKNHNQAIRKTVESNKFLSFLKYMTNETLNITGIGESIQCFCQKL